MYNYCTLFNSSYLTRGVAMYESLLSTGADFHLYIFAFDNQCANVLKALKLKKITVVTLSEFEDEALLKVKKDRTAGEYCWTCTPSIIDYSIRTFNLENCTYLDADLYFNSDPAVLIEEMGTNSVLITEHRYLPEYDCTKNAGIYCVQFVTFKNDAHGMKTLLWWKNACLDWCYARCENGKFGDQKYLDDWPERFDGIHVLQHPGGGVAPWNLMRYDLDSKAFSLVFYHFQDLKFLTHEKIELGRYKFRKTDIKRLYKPYIRHLESIADKLEPIGNGFDYHGTQKPAKSLLILYRDFKRWLEGSYNVYKKSELLSE